VSQHDMDIANAAGATVRADLNLALKALASFNSGAVAPTTPYAYQIYADTSTLPGADPIVYIRNGANTAWTRWGYINKTTGQFIVDKATEGGLVAGVKMIFYADTAPTGWTLLNTLDDKLLYITKGSSAGGQTGGGVHSTGSWTISGLTVDSHTHTGPSHTHTGPSHNHKWYEQYANNYTNDQSYDSGGSATDITVYGFQKDATHNSIVANVNDYFPNADYYTNNAGTGATGAAGTGASGAASVNTITSGGAWRPSAYCAIICSKD